MTAYTELAYRLQPGRCVFTGTKGTDLVCTEQGVLAHFSLREEAQGILDRIEDGDLGGYTLVHYGFDPMDYWVIEDRNGRRVAMNIHREGLARVLVHLNRN